MISLSGYQIIEKLFESTRTIIYRGRRDIDNRPVVIKLLSKEYPSPEETSRFRREYEIMQSLGLLGVARAYNWERYQRSYYIVMEDIGGESLDRKLKSAADHPDQTRTWKSSCHPGIGKTVLVQEIHKPITGKRGYFIAGKFDQFQRNIPYSAILQAFRSLLRQLLTESEEQLSFWSEKLKGALGPNGQVMLEVIPELELIIGPQPPVPELGPVETQNRFRLALQNFINVFARPEHPVAIFLDDLQWVDGASLKMIELLMTMPDRGWLFLICAYRDNEMLQGHPLLNTLEEIKNTGGLIDKIYLDALALSDITLLLADTLHCDTGRVGELAGLSFQKTAGNPFFLREFLKSLHVEGLLAFNYHEQQWQWEIERIQAAQVTENVVELMAEKIKKLPEPTREILKLAACIGNQFELVTLTILSEKQPRSVADTLWSVASDGLIQPVGNDYKYLQTDQDAERLKVIYRFAHDRIQQAAYSLIEEKDRNSTHLMIGRLQLQYTPEEKLEENIFDIVNQLNFGSDLIEVQAERIQLAELNLLAGKRARAAAAYEPALGYLTNGINLLPADPWQQVYGLTLMLYVEATETFF